MLIFADGTPVPNIPFAGLVSEQTAAELLAKVYGKPVEVIEEVEIIEIEEARRIPAPPFSPAVAGHTLEDIEF